MNKCGHQVKMIDPNIKRPSARPRPSAPVLFAALPKSNEKYFPRPWCSKLSESDKP